jgi:MEMO1 family protein
MNGKNYFLYIVVFFLFYPFLMVGCSENKSGSTPGDDSSVKQSEFAGQFYPADSVKLFNALTIFFKNAVTPPKSKPKALIVPHAGYIYSGQIAADAYNAARNFKYDIIVILGTNHTTAGFDKVSIFNEDAIRTPLGKAIFDKGITTQLLKEDPDVSYNAAVNKKEHSIEVQIPFIQYAFPGARIVPVIVASPDLDMCRRLGKTLASILRGKNALIVASSDLSHYTDFKNAQMVDEKTLRTIAAMDQQKISVYMRDELYQSIPALVTCACGEGAILTAVTAAKELGAEDCSLISYANSGHTVIGELERVVGYGAAAFFNEAKTNNANYDSLFSQNKATAFTLDNISDNDKIQLLKIARETIRDYLLSGITPLVRNLNPALRTNRGVFVTLKKNGELRGCIGRMSEEWPLYKVTGSMAIEAAFNDNRFSPLTIKELDQINIEISALTPFKQIAGADDITLGKDGVIIKKNGRQAVFLPQVATETGWDKIQFLDQLCRKAGLNSGDWKDAALYTFQAEVFNEQEFNIGDTDKK